MKYIVKVDDKIVLETESEAKAQRLYEKMFTKDGKISSRHDSVEIVYPPFREDK